MTKHPYVTTKTRETTINIQPSPSSPETSKLLPSQTDLFDIYANNDCDPSLKIQYYQNQASYYCGNVYKASFDIQSEAVDFIDAISIQIYGVAIHSYIATQKAVQDEKNKIYSSYESLNDPQLDDANCKILFLSDQCTICSNVYLTKEHDSLFYGYEVRIPPFLPPSFIGECTKYAYFACLFIKKRNLNEISNEEESKLISIRIRIPFQVVGPKDGDVPIIPTLAPTIMPAIEKASETLTQKQIILQLLKSHSKVLEFHYGTRRWEGGSMLSQASDLHELTSSRVLASSRTAVTPVLELSIAVWEASSGYRNTDGHVVDWMLCSSKLPYSYSSVKAAVKHHEVITSAEADEDGRDEIALNIFESENGSSLNLDEGDTDSYLSAYNNGVLSTNRMMRVIGPVEELSYFQSIAEKWDEGNRGATSMVPDVTMKGVGSEGVRYEEGVVGITGSCEGIESLMGQSFLERSTGQSYTPINSDVAPFDEYNKDMNSWRSIVKSGGDTRDENGKMNDVGSIIQKRKQRQRLRRESRMNSENLFHHLEEREMYSLTYEQEEVYCRDDLIATVQIAGRLHKLNGRFCFNAGSSVHATLDFVSNKVWTYEVHTYLLRKEETLQPTEPSNANNHYEEDGRRRNTQSRTKIFWKHRQCVIDEAVSPLILHIPSNLCPSFSTDIAKVSYELLFRFYCVDSVMDQVQRIPALLNKSCATIQVQWRKAVDVRIPPPTEDISPFFDGIIENDSNLLACCEDMEGEGSNDIIFRKDGMSIRGNYNLSANMEFMGDRKRKMNRTIIL